MTAEHKRGKRKWLQWGIILLLSAGILLGLIAFARPKWQTTRLSLEAKDRALIVELPADWTRETSHHVASTYFFYPPQPTGLWRWWNEHILKSSLSNKNASVGITVNERPAKDASVGRKELEMVAQAITSTGRRYFQDVETRWSTGAVMLDFEMEAHNAKRLPNTNQPDWRCTLLNSYDPIQQRSTIITVWMYADSQNYSQMKPTMDEIIRRLRLVQK